MPMTSLLEQFIGTRKLTPGHHVYKYPSRKMGGSVVTESPNENNFCTFLDYDNRVKGYISQPKTITYDLYQEGLEYTADFFADLYVYEPTFYEIKPKGYQASPEEEDKWNAIRKAYRNMGFCFTLVTGDYIEKGHRLENMNLLRRQLNKEIPDTVKESVVAYLMTLKKAFYIEAVVKMLMEKHGVLEKEALLYIYRCIANRVVACDIESSLLNFKSKIEVWNEEYNRMWDAVPAE